MDIENIFQGRFYTLINLPAQAAEGVEIGKAYEMADNGIRNNVTIRFYDDNGKIRNFRPERFRLPEYDEYLPEGTDVRVIGREGREPPAGQNPGWVGAMAQFVGTIDKTKVLPGNARGRLQLEIGGYWWHPMWLQRIGRVQQVAGAQQFHGNRAVAPPPVPPAPIGGFAAPRFIAAAPVRAPDQWIAVRDEMIEPPPAPKHEFDEGNYVRILNDSSTRFKSTPATREMVGKCAIIEEITYHPAAQIDGMKFEFASIQLITEAEYKKWGAAQTVVPFPELLANLRKKGLAYTELGECSWIKVVKGPKEKIKVYEKMNSPCHAGACTKRPDEEVVAFIEFVHDTQDGSKLDAEIAPWMYKYVDYLANRSPYAGAFLTKDAHEGVDQGILMDVSFSGNGLVCALIAIRKAREWAESLHMFKWAVEAGLSEDVAYLFMHTFTKTDDKASIKIGGFDSGHTCINGGMRFDELVKFLAKGFDMKIAGNDIPFFKATTYAVSNATCLHGMYPNDGQRARQGVHELCKVTVTGSGFNEKTVAKPENIIEGGKAIQQLIEKARHE